MTITLAIAGLIIVSFITYMYFTYKKVKNIPEAKNHSSIKVLN